MIMIDRGCAFNRGQIQEFQKRKMGEKKGGGGRAIGKFSTPRPLNQRLNLIEDSVLQVIREYPNTNGSVNICSLILRYVNTSLSRRS